MAQAENTKELMGAAPSKRELITRAALELFLEDGYGATSMDAIALRAAVSKRTVYSYFESKKALFGAVIEAQCEEYGGLDCEAPATDTPAEQVLGDMGRMVLSKLRQPMAVELHRVVMSECGRFPELGEVFWATGPGCILEFLQEFFSGATERGDLQIADPEMAARQFLGLVMWPTFMPMLLGVSPAPDDREINYSVDQAVSLFLAGLKAPAAA